MTGVGGGFHSTEIKRRVILNCLTISKLNAKHSLDNCKSFKSNFAGSQECNESYPFVI